MATTTSCRAVAVAALFLALLACCHSVTAQSPAPETAGAPSPAAGGGCFNALMNMSDCLTFVTDGSNQTKPDKGCCPELAGLYDSNPICLCELLGNPDSIGIKIDLNQALKLPSACGLDTPPVSTCSAVGVPVSLPPSMSMSPSLSPANGPSDAADVPSPGGPSPSSDEAASSPSQDKNGASGIQAASALTFLFGLSTLSFSILFF